MLNYIKKLCGISPKYTYQKDAIIIACYFNPQRNEYRKKAFDKWYDSIKHLNHYILEGVLEGTAPEIGSRTEKNGVVETIKMPNLLWHKETLLNQIIDEIVIENKFKYIFWLDTDVLFDSEDWLVDAVGELGVHDVVQPFEYCFHLERDQVKPTNSMVLHSIYDIEKGMMEFAAKYYKVWRSFGANSGTTMGESENYDVHGHVGFAWGARTSYLKKIGGLYDKALIGGSDHIMAHAFVGQVPCSCISKSFGDLPEIIEWSKNAYNFSYEGRISYVKGNLFHLWHGDTEKRQYYKRIKEFTPISNKVVKDSTGFYQADAIANQYFNDYFVERETTDFPISMKLGVEPLSMSDLFDSTNNILEDSNFDGGEFGGSGAGADWEDNNVNFS